MDVWKFYDITHREHVVCNPTSEDKLMRLVDLLRLPAGAQVVDIACGKGEFLIRLAEAYAVRGVGIDISSYYLAEAEHRLVERRPSGTITFKQMDGAAFTPDAPHSFDLASCIGASWVFGGHAQTLDALTRMVKPGGYVVAGEPFWLEEPPAEYLDALGITKETFGSHASNAEAGERQGLDLVHTIVSSPDDWDRYEGLQWYATSAFAQDHPDDPDVTELTGRVQKEKMAYLHWGRTALGWAIYMFRAQGPQESNQALNGSSDRHS